MAETLETIETPVKPKCYNLCELPYYTATNSMLHSQTEAKIIMDHEFGKMLEHSMDNTDNTRKFKKRLKQIFHGHRIPYESRMIFSCQNVTGNRDILMRRYIGDTTRIWFNNPTGYTFFQSLAYVEAAILYYKGMLSANTLFFAMVKIYLMHSKYGYDEYKPHRRIEFKDFLVIVNQASKHIYDYTSQGLQVGVPFPTGHQAYCNYNIRLKKSEILLTYQYLISILNFNRSFAENIETFVRETGHSRNYFYKIVKKYDFMFPGRRLPLKKRSYWMMNVTDDDWISLSPREIMNKVNAITFFPKLTINAVCMAKKRKAKSLGYEYVKNERGEMSPQIFLDLVDESKNYTWNCINFVKESGWSKSKFYQMVKATGIQFKRNAKKDYGSDRTEKICGAPVFRKDQETYSSMMGHGTDFWEILKKASGVITDDTKVKNQEEYEKNECKKSNDENAVSGRKLNFRNSIRQHQDIVRKWFTEKCDVAVPYSINLKKFKTDTSLSRYFFIKYMKYYGIKFISKCEFRHGKDVNRTISENRNSKGKMNITAEIFSKFSDTSRSFTDNCNEFMKFTGRTKMTFINWMHRCNVHFDRNKKGNIYRNDNKEETEMEDESAAIRHMVDGKVTESLDNSDLKDITRVPDENTVQSPDIPDGWKPKNEKERQDFEKLSARSYKIGMGKYTQECLKSIDEDLEEIAKKSFNFAGGHPWEESLAADKNKLCTEEDLPTLKFKPAPPATNDYERRIDKLIEYDKKTPDIFWEREMRKEMGLPYKGY